MNRLSPALYLLLAAFLTTSCGDIERPTGRVERRAIAEISRSWPAANIRELRVFEIDGSVSVQAAPSDQITLVATVKGDLRRKPGAENEGLFQTTIEGDTLRIGRKKEKRRRGFRIPFLFGRDEMRINYVLNVPPSVTLDLNTINGRIITRGVEGPTDASTINGTIDVETAGTHEVRATTVNGRVRAKFLRDFNGARFKTVNGGVEAMLPQNASFAVDLSQVNGDFEASFPLSIHSNPGSRRVSGEVNGGAHDLKIVTVNGDVELTKLNGAR